MGSTGWSTTLEYPVSNTGWGTNLGTSYLSSTDGVLTWVPPLVVRDGVLPWVPYYPEVPGRYPLSVLPGGTREVPSAYY